MNVINMPINKITPYARNPRKNEGLPVAKVKASIKEFGWQQPIVVDNDMVIIVGHTRYMAAMELGMTEVPVVIASHLTKAQVKAYRIADNKTATFSDWDNELLKLEMDDLKELDFDIKLTGFDDMEIEQFNYEEPIDNNPASSAIEIDTDSYKMGIKCPRCGFEFNDKKT